MSHAQHVVGVDLGGTKIAATLATGHGEVVKELVVPTRSPDESSLSHRLLGVVSELCADASVDLQNVRSVGLAAAGAVDGSTGILRLAPNLQPLTLDSLVAEIDARLECSVVVENDANAAALGELAYGAAKAHDTFAFLAVGTGLGMGLMYNGELLRGCAGAAGEIGFLPFGPDATNPRTHVRGALEERAAGGNISTAYEELTGEPVTTPAVFDLAKGGDGVAAAVLDKEAEYLAWAIAVVAAVIDPGLVFLGGGVGSRPEMAEPIRRWLRRFGQHRTEVVTSELGPRAAVLGAVTMALSDAWPHLGRRERSA